MERQYNPYDGSASTNRRLTAAKAFAAVAGIVSLAVVSGALVVILTHHRGTRGPGGATSAQPPAFRSVPTTLVPQAPTTSPGPSTTTALRAAVVTNFCSTVLAFQNAAFGTPSVNNTVPSTSALRGESLKMGFLAGLLGPPYQQEVKAFAAASQSGDMQATVRALDDIDLTCSLPMARMLGPSA